MVRVVRATKVDPRPKPWMKRGTRPWEIDLGVVEAHQVNGQGIDQQADEDQNAAVHHGGEAAHQRHDHQRADAAEGQGPTRQGGVVTHQGLEEEGQEHDAAVEDEAEKEHDGGAGGIVALFEEAQVHHRVLDLQLPPNQGDQGHCRDDGQAGDKGRRKPIFPLALIQDHLQGAQTHGQEPEAPVVDAAGQLALEVVRVEDEHPGEEHREDADGQVDVKGPAPGEVVGDPAAHDRADDGGDDHADAPEGHGHAAFLHREGLQQDGLGDGLQGAAAEALDDAEEDEFAQAGGSAAEHGADGEEDQADSRKRLRPTRKESQPVMGRMMALETR